MLAVEFMHVLYSAKLLTAGHAFKSVMYPSRDALLCSILDGVRASGNRDICVKMQRTDRGSRLGPLQLPVEEEVESQYLKYISNTPPGIKFSDAVLKFNSNVGYSGLNHAVTQEVRVVVGC